MMKNTKKIYNQKIDTKYWRWNESDGVLFLNIKKIKVHDHRSCDLMLNFEFKLIHHNTKPLNPLLWENKKTLFSYAQHVIIIFRNKKQILKTKTLNYYPKKLEQQQSTKIQL